MAITEEKKSTKPAAKTKKVAEKTSKTKKKTQIDAFANAKSAYRFLMEPWVTEKTHAVMSLGKYAFKVTKDATKKEVAKAVEGMYGVTVVDVRTVAVRAKKRSYGRFEGKKSGFKKAIVSLKKGDSISFFEGA
jgi:large subunit ribosomal protein L23